MSLSILIPQFEGPLGLLLYLIKKEEMDIFDIDVQLITSQYLDYIKKMKQFDLEVAGDFIAMAATLIQIKSKMLLPNYNEDGEEEEIEDPRKELVKRLLEYQQFQEASKKMYDRPLLGRDVFKRGGKNATFHSDEDGEIILDEGGLFSLIALYRGSVRKMKKAVHRVARKTRSIAGRILEIKDKLIVGQRVVLRDLIQSVDDVRSELLITFLSALELGKMGAVSVYQSEIYGDIYLRAIKPIDGAVVSNVEEYDSINADEIADNIMVEAIEEQELEEERAQEQADLPLMQAAEESDEAELETFEVATDEEIEAAESELNIDSESTLDVQSLDESSIEVSEEVSQDIAMSPSVEQNNEFAGESLEDRDSSVEISNEIVVEEESKTTQEDFRVMDGDVVTSQENHQDLVGDSFENMDSFQVESRDENNIEFNIENVDEEPELDGEPT